MSDQDNTLHAAAESDNNVNPNEESCDGSIGVEKAATVNSFSENGSVMTPTRKVTGSDDAKNDPDSTMKTIRKGQKPSDSYPLREEATMALTHNFPKEVNDRNKSIHLSSTSDTFVVPYAGGAALMDSTAIDNRVHNHHGNDANDGDGAPLASQSPREGGGSFTSRGNSQLPLDDASSSGREDPIGTYLGPTNKDIVVTEKDNKAQLKTQEDDPESSTAAQHLIQNISSDLDQKLDGVRSWTKKFLQELSVYVNSNNAITTEYGRIRKLEGAEKNRLDLLESNVNVASADMARRGSVGERGTPIVTTPAPIQQGNQQQEEEKERVPPGKRYGRHSLGSSTEALRPRHNRSLTPIMINKRRRSYIDRMGGKENRGKKRVSFGPLDSEGHEN